MAQSGKGQRRLSDGYSFQDFRAQAAVRGVFGDRDVRIVTLDRRSKKPPAGAAGWSRPAGTTRPSGGFATFRAPGFASSWNSMCVASRAADAVR